MATLRGFNRRYTQHIGVLDEGFLGTGRPLAQARMLFEVGPEGSAVATLRDRMGLDSGYASRLLGALVDDGLVALGRDPEDGRRRTARLTPDGRALWDQLDGRSDELARGLVDPLTAGQRRRLHDALAEAERLLRAATLRLEPVEATAPEAVAAVEAYFGELDQRFPDGFDPGGSALADAERYRPPEGVFLVARSDGEVVGCGGLTPLGRGDDDPPGRGAEVKRMWVHPALRGAGLGGRMLAALEAEAVALGYAWAKLDTNPTLTEALALYARTGWSPTPRYNDNPYAGAFFVKQLAKATMVAGGQNHHGG